MELLKAIMSFDNRAKRYETHRTWAPEVAETKSSLTILLITLPYHLESWARMFPSGYEPYTIRVNEVLVPSGGVPCLDKLLV
jgi:hypothetical protein